MKNKFKHKLLIFLLSALALMAFACKDDKGAKKDPEDTQQVKTDSPAKDDWLIFGKDLGRTNYKPDSNLKPPLKKKWEFTDEKLLIEFSASIAGDKLFVGADNYYMYCLDKKTGKLLWRFKTGGPIDTSPAIHNDKLFIGSFDGNMYCLDVNDGSVIWSTNVGTEIESSPAVFNDNVYFGATDGKVYALKVSDGSIVWKYDTGDGIKFSTAPAIYENKVYIASYNSFVYSLDAKTGKPLWKAKTGAAMYSSPAVSKGRVIIGNSDKNVYAFDADDGSVIWTYTTGHEIYSSPAIANGKVYIGSLDNKLYCLDFENGNKIWEFDSFQLAIWIKKGKHTGIINSPAVINGYVYSAALSKSIFALDANTGELVWNFPDGRYSLAVADDNTLYVAGVKRLIAFENKLDK